MMTISIMITTKDRSAVLAQTLCVLRGLDPQPLEILITADCCSDDTVEVVKRELPSARLIINEEGRGSVASRDRMLREAKGDLVLALDDDSYPEQMNCLRYLEDLFAKNPDLAVAAFPQRTDEYPRTLTQENFGEDRSIRSFACSGACLRVSTYRSLRGFEQNFFHMYEEPDYALQCVADGWDVIYTPAVTVRHHWTGSGRSELRNHHYHARNELWSTVMRCPFPQMLMMIVWRICSQARYAAGRGIHWLIKEPLWWIAAIKGLSCAIKRRQVVPWSGYKKWIALPDENRFYSNLSPVSFGRKAEPRNVKGQKIITISGKGIHHIQNVTTSCRISVICPSYNRSSFLESCVMPVMAIPRTEFILVDDGSTDATMEVARTFQGRFGAERVVMIPLDGNHGAQVARNRGMEAARGEMILFCDSDDVLIPSGVEALAEALTQNPDLDYAYGKVIMTDSSLEPLEGVTPIGSTFAEIPKELAGYHWHTMGALYRRSYLEKVGPWNLDLTGSQDWEYQARVKIAGGKALFVDSLVGYWRQHEGGRVGARKYRPDYVRSVVTACAVILDGARAGGKCDRALQQRLAKKLIIHALESGANNDHSLRKLCLSRAVASVSNDLVFFFLTSTLKHSPCCLDYVIYKKLTKKLI